MVEPTGQVRRWEGRGQQETFGKSGLQEEVEDVYSDRGSPSEE